LDGVKWIMSMTRGARAGMFALWVPDWLAGPGRVALDWAREHVFTVAGVGVLLGIAGLVTPFLLAWLQRRWSQRDAAATDQRGRARDRELMIKRVRNRWIKGVLEHSLGDEARIRLGLMHRPDMIISRGGREPTPLPAGTLVSAVFAEAGGVLLILGAPGSGKTTALLELTRDLLDQADADDTHPVPAVFNLSSWAAQRAPLAEWLIDELQKRYDVPGSIAARWVGSGEILPLLDGLDEVAEPYRVACVEAINAFRDEHGLVPFAVCSRTEEYGALETQLRVEDVVELQPPTHGQIYTYLEATGASLGVLQTALQADPALWELLASPLVLSIVARTYQGRSADALQTIGTPQQRLTQLFKAYTERMFEHRPGRYTLRQMYHWLGWLARSMREHSESEFHLDRLQPNRLPTTSQWLATRSPAIIAGLIVGLAVGLADGLIYGAVHGLAVGLEVGLSIGLFFGLRKGEPAEEIRWSSTRVNGGLRGGLVVGLVTGLIDGLIFGPGRGLVNGIAFATVFVLAFVLLAGLRKTVPVEEVRWSWPGVRAGVRAGLAVGLGGGMVYGLANALAFGVVYGLVVGLLFASLIGLVGALVHGLVPGLIEERIAPNEGIHRSARHALAISLVVGLIVALIVSLVFELIVKLENGVGEGLRAGLFVGLFVGLLFGGLACLQHLSLRGLLAYHDCAPLRYIRFLDDATERLFLRQTGSGYIFVHRLLLEYFADLQTTYQPAKTAPPVARRPDALADWTPRP
jgi:hypothetical protein